MESRTIDCGIDLGTTNSSIACMVNGRPAIVKNEEQSDTTPSCVYYSKSGQKFIGQSALKKYRKDIVLHETEYAHWEFKTKMGTDAVYRFPSVDRSFTPEELSADVLRALKSYVIDRDLNAAVITVPAAFGQNQIEATQRAAELAGFKQVELLPEPLAASMAYGIEDKNIEGYWLVFDMGGGTFDAVLMKMREGIMKVVDIAGDSRLGGKDIDYMIVDRVIIPYLKECFLIDMLLKDKQRSSRLRRLLKSLYAEDAKIALSTRLSVSIEIDDDLIEDDNGRMITDVCINLSRHKLEMLVSPMIERALSISREVCLRNKISQSDLKAVLLIGGPTFMPCVRERIRDELSKAVNTSIDPMTAVAKGAALYASTIPMTENLMKRDSSKVQLTIACPETTVESEVSVGIRIDRDKYPAEIPEKLFAEISGADGRWKSGRIALEHDSLLTNVNLTEGEPNCFNVSMFDNLGNRLKCEPDSFTILQGIKIDNPPLPLDICLEVNDSDEGSILKSIVRRGDVLPATGILRNLKTRCILRPGMASDCVSIPVYEGEEYTRPIYNRYIGELKITGEQVDSTVPVGSDVTVTMKIDTSRRKVVSVYIDIIDMTIEEVMPPLQKSIFNKRELKSSIAEAGKRIHDLSEKLRYSECPEFDELNKLFDRTVVHYEIAGIERDSCDMVADRIKELHRKLDAFEKEKQTEIHAGVLFYELDIIGRVVNAHSIKEEKKEFEHIREQAIKAVRDRDEQRITALTSVARQLYWNIKYRQHDYWIEEFNELSCDFSNIEWQDLTHARILIDRGKKILVEGYDDSLKNIVNTLIGLKRDNSDEAVRMDILESE